MNVGLALVISFSIPMVPSPGDAPRKVALLAALVNPILNLPMKLSSICNFFVMSCLIWDYHNANYPRHFGMIIPVPLPGHKASFTSSCDILTFATAPSGNLFGSKKFLLDTLRERSILQICSPRSNATQNISAIFAIPCLLHHRHRCASGKLVRPAHIDH